MPVFTTVRRRQRFGRRPGSRGRSGMGRGGIISDSCWMMESPNYLRMLEVKQYETIFGRWSSNIAVPQTELPAKDLTSVTKRVQSQSHRIVSKLYFELAESILFLVTPPRGKEKFPATTRALRHPHLDAMPLELWDLTAAAAFGAVQVSCPSHSPGRCLPRPERHGGCRMWSCSNVESSDLIDLPGRSTKVFRC